MTVQASHDNKIGVLVVDDEEPARALVKEWLTPHADLVVVGEAHSGIQAVQLANDLSPAIVFLDVQMPELDGFDVLQLLDRSIAVIFTTAYDEFALRAFEVNAVDYLQKPFSRQRFEAAVGRAKDRLGKRQAVDAEALGRAGRAPGSYATRIVVRDGAKVVIVPVVELDYIKGQGDYIELRRGAQSLLKQQTLVGVEQSLDPSLFVRIHRSYLLNIAKLARIEPMAKESKVAVLHDGRTLPISRAGEARLRQVLEQM